MMSQWLWSLAGKIAFSLVSATAVFCAGKFWNSILQPWIESLWYSGVRLEACYLGEFTVNGQKLNDLIELKQRAKRVYGTMTFPQGRQGKYDFEGTISENVLRGTFNGARMNPSSRGAFLIAVSLGSRELEGWFVEPYNGTVIAVPYKWTPHMGSTWSTPKANPASAAPN